MCVFEFDDDDELRPSPALSPSNFLVQEQDFAICAPYYSFDHKYGFLSGYVSCMWLTTGTRARPSAS